MSQKSSVPQAASFVSVVLKRDTNQRHFDYVWYRTFRWTLTPTKSRVQVRSRHCFARELPQKRRLAEVSASINWRH